MRTTSLISFFLKIKWKIQNITFKNKRKRKSMHYIVWLFITNNVLVVGVVHYHINLESSHCCINLWGQKQICLQVTSIRVINFQLMPNYSKHRSMSRRVLHPTYHVETHTWKAVETDEKNHKCFELMFRRNVKINLEELGDPAWLENNTVYL